MLQDGREAIFQIYTQFGEAQKEYEEALSNDRYEQNPLTAELRRKKEMLQSMHEAVRENEKIELATIPEVDLRELQKDAKKIQQENEQLKAERDQFQQQTQQEHTPMWTGFDDTPDELIPPELRIALQVYQSAIEQYDPATKTMNNKQTPRSWMIDKASELLPVDAADTMANRIATVAN